jgi:uncharacterized protein (TIGR03435 family)
MRAELRNVALSAVIVVIATRGIAFGQPGPSFEVSQVAAGAHRPNTSRTPEKIVFQAARVGDIMAFAYGLPLDRIERRPQWMYDDLFDVAVTTEAPTGLPEQKALLQQLLEKRFDLVVHRISNQSPVYFLVSTGNVNLTESKDGHGLAGPAFYLVPGSLQVGASGAGLTLAGWHVSMRDLAAWLYPQLQLPVLDKTGITGAFDIEISGLPLKGGSDGTIRAVRNSLGLNLEIHPGTAESLIIDHVEKPVGN